MLLKIENEAQINEVQDEIANQLLVSSIIFFFLL
jgi:hypothetical protein